MKNFLCGALVGLFIFLQVIGAFAAPHSVGPVHVSGGHDEFYKELHYAMEAIWQSIQPSPDFPQDKIAVFNDFILFCRMTETAVNRMHIDSMPRGTVGGNRVLRDKFMAVFIRLLLSSPISYEDFLAIVSISLGSVAFSIDSHYRGTFLMENVLEPLILDLKAKEYVGFHFMTEDFLPRFSQHLEDLRVFNTGPMVRGTVAPTMEEITLSGVYALTALSFLAMRNENFRESNYRWSNNFYNTYPLVRGLSLPSRPGLDAVIKSHYWGSIAHYNWLLYAKEELARNGCMNCSGVIISEEGRACTTCASIEATVLMRVLRRYLEMILLQLKERVFAMEKLYSDESPYLHSFRNLLEAERAELRSNPLLGEYYFQRAVRMLREIDAEIGGTPDAMQRSAAVDNQAQTDREWLIIYIRALEVMNRELHREENLRGMVELFTVMLNTIEVDYLRSESGYPGFATIDFWRSMDRRDWDFSSGRNIDIVLPLVKVPDGWEEL